MSWISLDRVPSDEYLEAALYLFYAFTKIVLRAPGQ